MRSPKAEDSSIYDQKEHYEIEKELAVRFLKATKEERQKLYRPLYDELFQRVKHHPYLAEKAAPSAQTKRHLKLLKKFINTESRFLEIDPGEGSLSLEVARHVKTAAAVDVSNKITSKINEEPVPEHLVSIQLLPWSSKAAPQCQNCSPGCSRGAKIVPQATKMDAPSPMK